MSRLLVGSRVRLGAINPEQDAALVARWRHDSEFDRMLDNRPPHLLAEKHVREWMSSSPEGPQGAAFMIRTLDGDRPIGFCAFEADQPVHRDAWIVIALGERDYWGRGFGTDAMNCLLRFGFLELDLHRASLGVFEYNVRAQRSYEKCGFRVEGRRREAMLRDGRRWDVILMGVLRSEWNDPGRTSAAVAPPEVGARS